MRRKALLPVQWSQAYRVSGVGGSEDYIFSVLASSGYQLDGVLIHHRFL